MSFSLGYTLYTLYMFFFFKQKTAYEMRISDWSSDVCSSDLSVHTALSCVAPMLLVYVPLRRLTVLPTAGALPVRESTRRLPDRTTSNTFSRTASPLPVTLMICPRSRLAPLGSLVAPTPKLGDTAACPREGRTERKGGGSGKRGSR